MPIYEYRCDNCGFQKEFLQKITDPAPTCCPECGQDRLKKMLSAAGFQLKGSGWYATDFKGGKADKGESKPSPAPACGAGACSACTGT